MENILKKGRLYILLFLIAVAPLHAFLITWIKSVIVIGDAGTLILSAWREILVVLIGIAVFAEYIYKRKWPKPDTIDYLIVAYTAIALVWAIFQRDQITQWMLGFRFDLLPLWVYLIIKHSDWPKSLIYKVFFGSAFVVMVFGILHALVLPPDFLMHFGFSRYMAEFDPNAPLAACQYLEHTQNVCRAVATFGGPTRYGTYLLIVLGLSGALIISDEVKKWWKLNAKTIGAIIFILALVNIVLTYSRSIWIGAAVSLFILAMWMLHKKRWIFWNRKTVIISVALAILFVVVGAVGFRYLQMHKNGPDTPQFFKSLFVRTNSTSEHLRFLQEGSARLIQNPMGIGLGKVGAASVRFNNKFLTENWYLQIALETGIISAILYVSILIFMMWELLKKATTEPGHLVDWERKGLFLALLAIAVTGFFTHSFEESTTSLLIFGFIGLSEQQASAREKN